jgi:phosphate transport system substrate-binding protein
MQAPHHPGLAHAALARVLAFVAGLLLGFASTVVFAMDIAGSGAASPYPLYAAWFDAYQKETGTSVNMSFKQVGSGEGIRHINERSVDFGASDVPLSNDDLVKDKLVQFPVVVSGVVPVANIPGVKASELKLTAKLIFQIYTGAIKRWNNPAIAELNKNIKLPDLPIRPFGRSDGAGTTYHFTYYLSKADPEWKQKFGYGLKIEWPNTAALVSSVKEMVTVMRITPGAFGFLEYGSANLNGIGMPQLRNSDGMFVSPGLATFRNALNESSWKSKGAFEDMLADMPGRNSWPITAGTYVLVPNIPPKQKEALQVLKFYTWSFIHGDQLVEHFGYMPLPDTVQARVAKEMLKVTDASGTPLVYLVTK